MKQKFAVGTISTLLVGSGIGLGYVFDNEVNVQEKIIYKDGPIVIKEVPYEVQVNVTKEVEVEVEKFIKVDNGNLDLAMEFIEDNLNEDIDMDYIAFEVDAQILGENYIEKNIIDLLDDEDEFDNEDTLDNYRKSEVSIKKISDAVMSDKDYEDKDLVLTYEVKMKAKEDNEDREYFSYNVTIPFSDGEMETDDVEVALI